MVVCAYGYRARRPGSLPPGTCAGDEGPCSYDVRVGMSTYQRNRRDIRSTTCQEPPLNVDLDSTDASEMPAAQPKTPARQPHVSDAEQSDVSVELTESTKSRLQHPDAQRVCTSQISDFRTIIKLQCNLEHLKCKHSNCERLNCAHSNLEYSNCEHLNIEFHLSVSVKLTISFKYCAVLMWSCHDYYLMSN